MRAWRAAHPGWRRPRPPEQRVLQDSLIAQVTDAIEKIPDSGAPPKSPAELALQNSLNPLTALLAGLIAHLFELTLQDDFDSTKHRLVQRGQNLMRSGAADEDQQTRAAPRAAAPSARAVQLG